MKILLIKPPANQNLISVTRYEPLELEYLAAAVKEHDVEIFDMRIEKNLMKMLGSFRPNLVGITAYTCDVKTAKNILKEVKKYDSSIKTVIGGNHATFLPHDFEEPFIDTIFLGYADQSFKEYINALEENKNVKSIKNLGLLEDNKIFFTEKKPFDVDLDSLPMPARHLTQKYRKKYHDSLGNKLALVMSSRGCPFRCTFCACWKLMDGRYVTRNVESIIKELENLSDDPDIIYFSDDNTVHNIKRAWEFSEMMKEHSIKKKLQMYARADNIVKHPDLFKSLKESGLEYLTVGFESFKDEELKKLNKMTSVKINSEAIRILKKLEIHVIAHFIINPDYTKEDFHQLFQYIDDNALFRPAFPVLTPLPGTELYKKSFCELVIRDYNFFDFTHSILPTKLSRKEFYHQLSAIYRKSYSIKRFLNFKYKSRKNIINNSYPMSCNTDGISLSMLLMINIFAIRQYLKLRNAYKSEIFV